MVSFKENKALRNLRYNASHTEHLDLNECTLLEDLVIIGGSEQFTLNVDNCKSVKSFKIIHSDFSLLDARGLTDIKSITITGCDNLVSLEASGYYEIGRASCRERV